VAFTVVFRFIFSGSEAGADEWEKPGRFKVTADFGQWKDSSRDEREVPFKVYAPVGDQDRLPVILFSHGGGGSREGNSLLGNHLASHGFVCIHLQHAGTDDRAFRRSPRSTRDAANDPKICADRFRDVAFAVKQIDRNEVTQKLRGKLDPSRVGISGHSLGGITTQVIAGQYVQGFDQQFCLPNLRGAVILSPSPPRPGFGDAATAFRDMKMPMLSITGTADVPPDKSFPAKERRIPFDRTENVEQWLLVLDGATHFTFSGNTERPRIASLLPGMEADPNLTTNHAIVKAATLAFWCWTLLEDENAKSFLNSDLADTVPTNGTVEHKTR
jgi:predicted dienelactone hydrolase